MDWELQKKELREFGKLIVGDNKRTREVDIGNCFQIMDDLIDCAVASGAERTKLLPFNYSERVQYILEQPTRYHARVQLRELLDEFIKKYSVWYAVNREI